MSFSAPKPLVSALFLRHLGQHRQVSQLTLCNLTLFPALTLQLLHTAAQIKPATLHTFFIAHDQDGESGKYTIIQQFFCVCSFVVTIFKWLATQLTQQKSLLKDTKHNNIRHQFIKVTEGLYGKCCGYRYLLFLSPTTLSLLSLPLLQ